MPEREDNICTLSERLESIENELAKYKAIVDVLYADYNVKHIDRPNIQWYELN